MYILPEMSEKHNFIAVFLSVKATRGGENTVNFNSNKFKAMVNKWEIINILDFSIDFYV